MGGEPSVERMRGALARHEHVGGGGVEREAREAVVEENPGAVGNPGAPEVMEDALDKADGIAAFVRHQKVRRVLAFVERPRRHHRCSLANLGAALCQIGLAEEFCQRNIVPLRVGEVGEAIREGTFFTLDESMGTLRLGHTCEIEALRKRQLLREDHSLRGRRLTVNGEATVAHGERRENTRFMGREILQRKVPLRRRHNLLGNRASVERVAASLGNLFQAPRQLGMTDDRAQRGSFRPQRLKPRHVRKLGEFFDGAWPSRVAVSGIANRGS